MRINSMIRFLIAPAMVLLAACESATGSDGSGAARMQMAAAGDDGASASRTAGDAPRYQVTSAQGTVSFEARAYVQTSAGAWVELTDGAYEQVSVAASSTRASARTFASGNVAATSYTRVRLVFREVDADVQGVWDYPNVTLRLTAEGYGPLDYAAQFPNARRDTLRGPLTGSGFAETTLTIVRQ